MTIATPVQMEIEKRLAAAFPGAEVILRNDSAHHRGHSGDNGSGESHFHLTIYWKDFADMNRVTRQRMVNKALDNMLNGHVHALSIRALVSRETN